eukprot:6764806-Prymnesium_polylepis.1
MRPPVWSTHPTTWEREARLSPISARVPGVGPRRRRGPAPPGPVRAYRLLLLLLLQANGGPLPALAPRLL